MAADISENKFKEEAPDLLAKLKEKGTYYENFTSRD